MDYGLTILLAVAVALAIRIFVLEAFRIPTPAMVPALEAGDTIFVAKWKYAFGKVAPPGRGSIVVFSLPEEPDLNFIKRVIGLPGDAVEVKDGNVILNSRPIAGDPNPKARGDRSGRVCATETLPGGKSYAACRERPLIEDFPRQIVPQGSVFVIGDLRALPRNQLPESRKVRGWGIIPISSIKGEALWIWLSVQPKDIGEPASLFPTFRWSRMFHRIS